MSQRKIQLPPCWLSQLSQVFEQAPMLNLRSFLINEQKNFTIYPPMPLVFQAFHLTPLDQVKVVIIGQDPYHGLNQAHGLSFSVQDHIKVPPSLQNIFQELANDLQIPIPKSGDLSHWARQGVFLLNTILTVRANQPLSHKDQGWEFFTKAVIDLLNRHHQGLVFMLWGSHAKSFASALDQKKHLVLKAAHPSPYAADQGFFGSKPFSKSNQYLASIGKSPIIW
jgi:uracil-DNA glycosylase